MKLDTTIPTFMLSVSGTSGAGGWYVSSIHINSGAVDITSGLGSVQYSVDGGALQAGNSAFISIDGSHTVSFRAIDNAGNMSTSSTQTVKIDTTGPAITVTLPTADGLGGWYKTAPVTVTALASDTTSGLSSTQYSLDGGALQAGSSVIVATDGTHTVSFRAVDNAGNVSSSSTQTVKIDTTEPAITSTLPSPDGSGGWYKTAPVTVTALASDATSGLGSVQYSLDGGALQVGNSTLISTDGTHTVSFRAVDNAGNTTTSPTQTVKVDTIGPAITVTLPSADGTGGWYKTAPVTVTALAGDVTSGLSSIQYSVDGDALQAGSSALISTDGLHTVSFRAVDNAGNTSNSSTQIVNVDTVVPTFALSVGGMSGSGGWYVSPINVDSGVADATSGLSNVQYSVDSGAFQFGSSVTISADGTHTVSFQATDKAGNMSTSLTQTVKVDTTVPTFMPSVSGTSGANGWYVSPIQVNSGAADSASGLGSIQYSLDGGAFQAGSSVTISTDGAHTVSFRAIDNAGNVSISSTQTVEVDTTGPVITSTTMGTMGGGGWYITTAQVIASATDATSGLSGIQYSIDSGGWQSAPIQVGDGTHNIQIRATDVASNSTTNTVVVKVDIVRPASLFVSPPEGTSAVAAGDFTMTGHTVDVDSGPQGTEVSIDNGANWQALPAIDSAGNWTFVWDTTSVANGTYTVFVRATDLAGNQENTAQVTVIVSNQAPFIKIAAEWWIWEAGQLVVEKGSSPITGVTITVSDPKGRWPNRVWSYYASQIPGSVSWDRHFGETIAPSGNYDVKATVCDIYNSCSNAYGIIKIPYPSTPTPTQVASQTPAQTPALTQEFPTEEPTKQVVVVVPVSTPAIVIVLENPPVGPAKLQFAPKAFLQPRYLFPTIGMVSLFIALAAAHLTDKRPRAIRQLAKSLKEYGQQTNRFNP
jgi:glutamine cyclotransferase